MIGAFCIINISIQFKRKWVHPHHNNNPPWRGEYPWQWLFLFVKKKPPSSLRGPWIQHEYSGYQNVLHFNMLAHSMHWTISNTIFYNIYIVRNNCADTNQEGKLFWIYSVITWFGCVSPSRQSTWHLAMIFTFYTFRCFCILASTFQFGSSSIQQIL